MYAQVGTLAEVDTSSLHALCDTWTLYRKSVELAMNAPADKELRCAVTGYLGAFDRLASKFGLTPSDRAAIKLESKAKKGIQSRKRA